MFRRIFSLMVLMITVLTVNLLTGWITDHIIRYGHHLNPLKFTAIAMLALVFILVPAYSLLHQKTELLIARTLLAGRSPVGRIAGLLFSFLLLFAVLFSIYLYEWFDLNIIHLARNWLKH